MGIQVNQGKLKAMAAELAKGIKSEKELGILTQQLVKLTVETALNAELDEHLGYEKHAPEGRGSGNSRNGYSGKPECSQQGAQHVPALTALRRFFQRLPSSIFGLMPSANRLIA